MNSFGKTLAAATLAGLIGTLGLSASAMAGDAIKTTRIDDGSTTTVIHEFDNTKSRSRASLAWEHKIRKDAKNGARVVQKGEDNAAGIGQSGKGNAAVIKQKGKNHNATAQQTGNNNAVGVYQKGKGTDIAINQTGDNQGAIVFQRGR